LFLTLAIACAGPLPATPPSETPAPVAIAARGETAHWTVEGGEVHVNNRLCAVSHSPLDPAKLDAYVSRVAYAGEDLRFAGKTLVFNQCCEMCVERFPKMWREDPDGILRFHGLL
jgi:hypothetical protein